MFKSIKEIYPSISFDEYMKLDKRIISLAFRFREDPEFSDVQFNYLCKIHNIDSKQVVEALKFIEWTETKLLFWRMGFLLIVVAFFFRIIIALS